MAHLLKTMKFCFYSILEVITISTVFMFIAFFDSITFTIIIFIKFGEPTKRQAASKGLIDLKELFVMEEVKVFMLKIYTIIAFICHLTHISCSLKKLSLLYSSLCCLLSAFSSRLTLIGLEAIMILQNCWDLFFYFRFMLNARIEFSLFINLK